MISKEDSAIFDIQASGFIFAKRISAEFSFTQTVVALTVYLLNHTISGKIFHVYYFAKSKSQPIGSRSECIDPEA